MKRKAVNLAVSVAELIRFFVLMLLADSLGALRDEGSSERIFRYAATPQILFAAGFFFLWFDGERYGSYKPLLALGKIAGLVAFIPVALLVASWFRLAGLPRNPERVLLFASFIALVDLFALAALLLNPAKLGRESRDAVSVEDTTVPVRPEAGTGGEAGIEKVEV